MKKDTTSIYFSLFSREKNQINQLNEKYFNLLCVNLNSVILEKTEYCLEIVDYLEIVPT